jgi:hypothetical protein
MTEATMELIREGEYLYLVVDGERVVWRDGKGQWRSAEPGWNINYIEAMDLDGRIWDCIEFSHEGELCREAVRANREPKTLQQGHRHRFQG